MTTNEIKDGAVIQEINHPEWGNFTIVEKAHVGGIGIDDAWHIRGASGIRMVDRWDFVKFWTLTK